MLVEMLSIESLPCAGHAASVDVKIGLVRMFHETNQFSPELAVESVLEKHLVTFLPSRGRRAGETR